MVSRNNLTLHCHTIECLKLRLRKGFICPLAEFLNLFSRLGVCVRGVCSGSSPVYGRRAGAQASDSAPWNSEQLLGARNAALGCSPFPGAVRDYRGWGLDPRPLGTRRRWWWAAPLHLPPRAGERRGIYAVVAQLWPGLRPSAQRGLCRCRERWLRLRRRPGGQLWNGQHPEHSRIRSCSNAPLVPRLQGETCWD